MLLDSHGNLIPPSAPRVVDPIDGYDPSAQPRYSAEFRSDAQAEVERLEAARADGADLRGANLDGFVNELTGIGTLQHDKSLGGLPGGPLFRLNLVSGAAAEVRARGSDIGRNIVNKVPDAVTRAGWDVEVQPSEDEQDIAADPVAQMDASIRDPRRAAAGWRQVARKKKGDAAAARLARGHARRWDAFASPAAPPAGAPPDGKPPAPPAPPPPGPLPRINDEGIELSEAMDKWATAIGVVHVVNEALKYERLFGGGAVFIGVDDGVKDLTQPLDPAKVKAVTHLTAFTGGFDGEVVVWRPYNDPRAPKYGQPEIYQVRNLSVSIARPPAPGEVHLPQQLLPLGPTGPTIFYVHESRFLIFNGEPTSRQAQQAMRGWGDSIFTRVNEPLAQYEQTWGAITILMTEFSIATLAIKGLSVALAKGKEEARQQFLGYARFQALTQSVARQRFIDADEKFERVTASVAGVAEIIDKMNLRIAAAADEPIALLFGQGAGGLGDSDSNAADFFRDEISSKQVNRLLPELMKLYRLAWRAKNSPTKGIEPERWAIVFRPLKQLSATEQADLRLKVTQADQIEIANQVLDPDEVAAARHGGPEWSDGPIVLNAEARAMFSRSTMEPGAGAQAPSAGTGALELTPTTQGAIVKVNQALAALSLPPLTRPDGTIDPDGELTIAEFTAKHSGVVAAAENAQAGQATAAPNSTGATPEAPASPRAPAAPAPARANTPPSQHAAEEAQRVNADPLVAPDAPKAPEQGGSGATRATLPSRAMPSDPQTGDPSATPSVMGNTDAGAAHAPAGTSKGGQFVAAAAATAAKVTGHAKEQAHIAPSEAETNLGRAHIVKQGEGVTGKAKGLIEKGLHIAANAGETAAGLLAPEIAIPVEATIAAVKSERAHKIGETLVEGAKKLVHKVTDAEHSDARNLAEAIRILTGEDEDTDEETVLRSEGWESVDEDELHEDAANDQPRDQVGRFAAVEGARATVAEHIAKHLSSKEIGATAEGSSVKLHLGGTIEIGRKGERTYSGAGAHAQNVTEEHLTTHPAKHIATWAKKTTPTAAKVLALPAHVEPSKKSHEMTTYEEKIKELEAVAETATVHANAKYLTKIERKIRKQAAWRASEAVAKEKEKLSPSLAKERKELEEKRSIEWDRQFKRSQAMIKENVSTSLTKEEAAEQAEDLGHYEIAERIRRGLE